jgi:hypothetical protein
VDETLTRLDHQCNAVEKEKEKKKKREKMAPWPCSGVEQIILLRGNAFFITFAPP